MKEKYGEEFEKVAKKYKINVLKNVLLTETSYHHTSKEYNITYFYSVGVYFKKLGYSTFFKFSQRKNLSSKEINRAIEKHKKKFGNKFIKKYNEVFIYCVPVLLVSKANMKKCISKYGIKYIELNEFARP